MTTAMTGEKNSWQLSDHDNKEKSHKNCLLPAYRYNVSKQTDCHSSVLFFDGEFQKECFQFPFYLWTSLKEPIIALSHAKYLQNTLDRLRWEIHSSGKLQREVYVGIGEGQELVNHKIFLKSECKMLVWSRQILKTEI